MDFLAVRIIVDLHVVCRSFCLITWSSFNLVVQSSV